MSGYEAARPRYTLPLAGKDYELIGTFELIEAVENALQDGIVQVASRVVQMGTTDTAKLIAILLSTCGHKMTIREAGGALFDLGVDSDAYATIKLHLFAFLRIILAPPADREAKAKDMGELLGKLGQPASPGESTNDSA